jgi:hypothetical protein
MATINLGAIKFNWKGAYNSGTTYAVDDVVSSGGNSYVCIQASTGNAVGNATAYWNIMSSAGTNGSNGSNGSNGTDVGTTITTQGDILYRDGSGLQRLGAGTSGQLLQSGGSGANVSWTDAPAGITMADQWRPSVSISGNNQLYTSGWERIDTDSPGYIGSAMTESSGIFTFPSTGKYWIQFRATMQSTSITDYVGSYIEQTADNSSYSRASIAYESTGGSSMYVTSISSFLFNVSNTSTHKVRFGTPGNHNGTANFIGGTGSNESEVTFIRLGD